MVQMASTVVELGYFVCLPAFLEHDKELQMSCSMNFSFLSPLLFQLLFVQGDVNLVKLEVTCCYCKPFWWCQVPL